jgi:hypothetical protein
MKYKIPITYHSKDLAKVKVFKQRVKLQGQGKQEYRQRYKIRPSKLKMFFPNII